MEVGFFLLVATKKGIVADEVVLDTSGEMVCSRVVMAKSGSMYVCAFYKPPSDALDSLDALQRALEGPNQE